MHSTSGPFISLLFMSFRLYVCSLVSGYVLDPPRSSEHGITVWPCCGGISEDSRHSVDCWWRHRKCGCWSGLQAKKETTQITANQHSSRKHQIHHQSKGRGLCRYVHHTWCTKTIVIDGRCSSDLEYLRVNCRPFYLQRDATRPSNQVQTRSWTASTAEP